jgi:hypothetical protein
MILKEKKRKDKKRKGKRKEPNTVNKLVQDQK